MNFNSVLNLIKKSIAGIEKAESTELTGEEKLNIATNYVAVSKNKITVDPLLVKLLINLIVSIVNIFAKR